jgi:hypothetical protein
MTNALHTEKRNALHSSNQEDEMVVDWLGRIWEIINAYKMLVRKLEIKRLLGTTIRRWKDNIKMHIKSVRV